MVSGSVLLNAFITLVVVGIICWLVWWFISYIALPEPFAKVARVLVALVALIFLINFLLGLTGHPLIRW